MQADWLRSWFIVHDTGEVWFYPGLRWPLLAFLAYRVPSEAEQETIARVLNMTGRIMLALFLLLWVPAVIVSWYLRVRISLHFLVVAMIVSLLLQVVAKAWCARKLKKVPARRASSAFATASKAEFLWQMVLLGAMTAAMAALMLPSLRKAFDGVIVLVIAMHVILNAIAAAYCLRKQKALKTAAAN